MNQEELGASCTLISFIEILIFDEPDALTSAFDFYYKI